MSPRAQAIAEMGFDKHVLADVADRYADALEAEQDPDFDRAEFISACGVEP